MIWLFVIFLVAELFYFRIADKFNIIDKPNQRSSHSYITRRGGGIIFPFAWIVYSSYSGLNLPWFTLGLLIISGISFWDDVREVGIRTRISLHIIALSLAFYDLGIVNMLPWWGSLACLIISIAALNAINFMDGINGITGLYALCFWVSVALFAGRLVPGEIWDLASPLPYMILSLLIFGFFNFRKKAVCFAGDVGSVSMAYLMLGMTAYMIFRPDGVLFTNIHDLKSGNYTPVFDLKYLLLLSVYGVDSLLTIIHRLFLKENIFKGHRKHLYQYMVNELKLPHLAVASCYAAIQIIINFWVLNFEITILNAFSMLTVLSVVYVSLKVWIIQQTSEPVFSALRAIKPVSTLKKPVELVALEDNLDDLLPPIVSSRKAMYDHESSRQKESVRS